MGIGTISTKGQITIPAHVRKKMSLKSGDKVLFEERPDGFAIKKVKDIFEMRGCIGPAKTSEEERILAEDSIVRHVTGPEV